MGKRKEDEDNWERDELAVPLPIQIFLWRQSSPFIRPKLGKLHEATCLEIKEASKSLEKVLVQNILYGLSPSLTEAIRSVPRWRFVQAAFPHVMHCAATLLYNRRDSTITNLGAVETKLLYTLHWILLDAAEECADADAEKHAQKNASYYLFSVSSVQVFIYMFAPILQTLKESDFQNFRLENGLKIWNALWEFRHPDVPVFTTVVRPRRSFMKGKRIRKSHTQFGDVFLGTGKPQSPDDDSVFFLGGFEGRLSRPSASSPHETIGSVSSQDSRSFEALKLEEELRLMGGPREASFPETIPEETSSTEEEHVVIFRLGSDTDGLRESQVYKAEHPSSLLRPPMVEVSDVNGLTSTQIQSPSQPPSVSCSTPTDSRHCGGMSPFKANSICSGGRASPLSDPTLATIMDIAVLRCLFVHQWNEEGVFWALTFVYRRMQEIGHEVSLKETPRKRSNSLPVPKIHVSLHCDSDSKDKDQEGSDPSSSEHNFISDSDTSLKRWTESETETSRKSLSKEDVSELPVEVEGVPEGPKKPLISRRSFVGSFGKKTPEDDTAGSRPRKLWIDLKVLTFTAFGYKRNSTSSQPPENNTLEETSFLTEGGPKRDRESGGSTRKKKKMSDLKAFVETKLRSRSEKALEKIGIEDSRRSSISEDQGSEAANTFWKRPHSALETLDAPESSSGPLSPFSLAPGLVKGKSMPSLRFVGSSQEGSVTKADPEPQPEPGESRGSAKVKRPIITVTQHTPSPSEHGWKEQVGLSSVLATCAGHIPFMVIMHLLFRHSCYDTQLSQAGSIDSRQYQCFATPHPAMPKPQPPPTVDKGPPKPPLARSYTDSEIQYPVQDAPEVPGTSYFVTRDGHINLKVLLKAMQSITYRDSSICSLRVCELILHLLDFLLDMGILKYSLKISKMAKMKEEDGDSDNEENSQSDPFSQDLKECNPVEGYMDTTMQIIAHLGCPHGCGEGCRGPPADFLRHTAQALLSRIYRTDQNGFKKYLRSFVTGRPLREVIDFFHAFLGFCVDPASLLSPMSEWLTRMQDTKRPGTGRTLETQQGGYATNFGASLGGAGSRGIEGQLVACVLKSLVTRFVKTEALLKNPDYMAAYSDIRQLMCYIKEAHGGVFRRVALSGLIDSADRPHRKAQTTQTTRIVKRLTISDEASRYSPGNNDEQETTRSKKSLFKKKGTSSSITSTVKKVPSVSSIFDDQNDESSVQSPASTLRKRQKQKYGGRYSDSEHLVPGSRKKKVYKIVKWIRKSRKKEEEVTGLAAMMFGAPPPEPSVPQRKFSQASHVSRPRLVTKPGSGQLGQKFLKAKRKMEDQLGKMVGKNKRGDSNSDETPDLSRRNSEDLEASLRETSVVLVRDRKIIDGDSVKEGMLRFTFLLETCQPGSVPDAQLAGAIIDLPGAPVIARASLLLEMAHFVHKCNKGAWPSWMKSYLPFFRPSGSMGRAPTAGTRRVPALQRAAGKMFYGWAEAIAIRLEELFEEVGPKKEDIKCTIEDTDLKNSLRSKDEEEDFLDELNVNPGGGDCPMALRLIAVHLLLEITCFLRETYPLLPKSGRTSVRERPGGWQGSSALGVRHDHSRRWSTTLSSMGPTHASAQSLHSMGEGPMGTGERKISFALHEAADNESVNSSNTTLTSMHINEEDRRRANQAGRGSFLKKTGGSFKRRSYKLKRAPKDPDSDSIKRSDSIRSRRKVSAVSERSDTSEHLEHDASGDESPGVLSNEDIAETSADADGGDENITGNFPWLKIVTKMATSFNTSCTHQNFCHPFCHRRQMRACKRLIHAVKKVYGEEFEGDDLFTSQSRNAKNNLKKEKKLGRKSSEPAHGSPTMKRKDSIGKKDRMDKGVDLSAVLSRLGHQGSVMQLSKDTFDENEKDDSKTEKNQQEHKKEQPHPILKYLQTQLFRLFAAPFALIIKSIAIISEEFVIQVLPMAWEMLLEYDNEIAANAAVIFILSGVRTPALANTIINGQLTHSDPSVRLNAILRFQVIWRSRYQVWARMEEGAHVTFKVPPHGIEFTLPSPKVGVESIPVVEPPWMPQVKLNVEEVTLDQIQHKRSFITANRTRRKIHAEMVKTALEAEGAKRRLERENFLLSAVPVTIQAAYEPSLHHVVAEEHEDAEDNEAETSGRPVSSHHVSVAQQLFPSCLCSSVLTVIHLLDDPAVTPDGVAVYQAADQVIWSCLVEDSALFLRFFLEKLTREKQDVMTRLLRRLVRFISRLPSQAAFALFNYLVGYVMFYTRSPQEGSQEHTAAALSILWTVVPSVHGILFKDLKQIFRKEQCDSSLLLTANIPSAKKIIVHGPGGADAGGIPSQFPIQEDTQFSQIHVEAVDFFGISEDDSKYYFLVDHKTNQIHNMHSYVRDFYFFKRSQYPQLILVRMEPEAAFEALQKQAFMQKFLEIGKVMLAYSVLLRPDQVQQRVFFLHEELTKLPSFPRKALEADFNLYKGGSMDKEIRGLDQLHKYTWVQLVARMFEGMATNLNYTTDLRIFISVINGALILHCEDSSMLTLCMATYINAATQFKNLFATNEYMLIMPTILRVYSNYQSNKMVGKVIEMVVKQLYLLHRKPFILQMLGSVAPLLDTDETLLYGDANKIRGSRLFDLLHSLDRNHEDHLHILDLVSCEKPLKALDFCYHEESDNLSLLEIIDMCVTVVAYAADSRRGHQMLAVLEAILARTLKHYHKTTRRDFRQEKEIIHHVAVAIKTLIINSEPLAKNYNGPQLSGMGGSDGWGSNRAAYTKSSKNVGGGIDPDEDSHSRYVSDPKKQPQSYQSEGEDPEIYRRQFRQPRAMFLNIVAEFFQTCTPRLAEINRKFGHETKQSDLLDTKCQLRLADLAHSLLKMAPYDPLTMGCRGLQRYMNEILPSPDWSHEDLRPALVNILRRLEKMFNKIAKKSAVRRITDWKAASNLLNGIYTTLSKHPYIAHLPHLKMLVSVCQSLILGEKMIDSDGGAPNASWANAPPQEFTSIVVRIIAMQILALGVTYSLEQICGGSSLFPNSEKTESLLVNLLLPMCLRIGCAGKDTPRMRQVGMSFTVTVILHAMNPLLAKLAPVHTNTQNKSGQPAKASQQAIQSKASQPARSGQSSDPRTQSWSHYHADPKTYPKVKPVLLKIAFLGLKVMMVCFDKQLANDWYRILHCLRDMDKRNEGGLAMYDFIDFSVSYRTGLYPLIKPFVLRKLNKPGCNESVLQYKEKIRSRLNGSSLHAPACKGALIRTMGEHLKILREELLTSKVSGDAETLRPPSLEIHSEVQSVLRKSKTTTTVGTDSKGTQSPTSKLKEEVSTSSTVQEPRLYRKTFQLRKRASSASLRPEAKGEGSVVASPTSPNEGSTETGSTSEDGGGRHRLQRQMAQSRKTFRFRKSRHGPEVKVSATSPDKTSDQSISHINVEPSQYQSVSPVVTSAANESLNIRQLQVPVPLIPEEDNSGASSPNYSIAKTHLTSDEGILTRFRDTLENVDTMEMQVRPGYRQAVSNLYHDKSVHDEPADTISYHSYTPDSSQTSRRSSVSSKKHVTIDPNLSSSPYERREAESQPYAFSQFVHPSGQVSVIPSISYRREEPTTLRYAREYPEKSILRDPPRSSGVYQHPSSQMHSLRQPATFYDDGPNFRHSWTEGEEAAHLQSYPRERETEVSRNTKVPQRKTGIRYTEPPRLSDSLMQDETGSQRYYHPQESTKGNQAKTAVSSGFGQAMAQQQIVYTSEVARQTQVPSQRPESRSKYKMDTLISGGDKSSQYGREGYRQARYTSDGSKLYQQYHSSEGVQKQRAEDGTKRQKQYSCSSVREHFSKADSSEEPRQPIIISGSGLPEGTKRFVVDKFTVTFTSTDKDEEDTLI